MDMTTSYIASRFASSSSSCLMVLLAQIFHISLCVGVAFSSRFGGVKVATFPCFRCFHTSAPFLYVIDAYNCSFSNAFRYRSGPFLAIENLTPLSNSGKSQSWSACIAALLFFPCFFLLNLVKYFFSSPSSAFTLVSPGSTMVEVILKFMLIYS